MSTLLLSLCLLPAGGPPVFDPPAVKAEPPSVSAGKEAAPKPKTIEKKDEPSVRRLTNDRAEITYKGRVWTTEPNSSEAFVSQLKRQLKAEVDGQPATTFEQAATKTSSYVDAPGTHRHRCPVDGTVWTHPDRSRDEFAHNCPKCGQEQLDKYRGPEPPTAVAAKTKDPFQFLNLTKTTEPLTIVRTFRSNGVVYQELSDGTIRTCPNCPYVSPSYSRRSR